MADVKIANLTAKTTWADTDLIIVEDGTDTKKMTVATLKSLIGTEVGTNANGSYIKHSNGTLECYISIAFAEVANTLTYRTVTYPYAFLAGSTVVANISVNSVTAEWSFGMTALAFLPNTGNTDGLIASRYGVSQTYTYGIHLIGRWKA